ncbi:hypothetical protein [Paraliobacillus salinarum]|uniref:hypothetical protein n=1 Tax=Paraliobacillus salinarum TaxID=1158996 RepID=UPI0015F68528|nr:hypothetical protein [Paraliobacillus salinarum]
MSNNFYSKLGIFIVALGFIGAIGIISSFDWETWSEVKEYPDEYMGTFMALKSQLTSVWTTAITSFVGSLAVGAVLMALGRIVELLEDIRGTKPGNREKNNIHKPKKVPEPDNTPRINW